MPEPEVEIEKPKNAESDIELTLIDLWMEILCVQNISTTSNFFELGGDSILAIKMASSARKLGLNIKVSQIFEGQTIESLGLIVTLDNNKKTEKDFEEPLIEVAL